MSAKKAKKKTAKKAKSPKKKTSSKKPRPKPASARSKPGRTTTAVAYLIVAAGAAVWAYTSWDLARTTRWTPVTAKALSHGSLTTSGIDPGDETSWGSVSTLTSVHTVVTYEFDGIAYQQRVPGELELGSRTEGVVDPDNPGRWRWSESTVRWWVAAVSALVALVAFRFVRRRSRVSR